MKLFVNRRCLQIEPENETEIAYIEEVLGLDEDKKYIRLTRINASGLSCIAYLEAKKDDIKTHGCGVGDLYEELEQEEEKK